MIELYPLRSCVALNELSLLDFAEAADPFALFELWLAEAAASEINDPEAIPPTQATASVSGSHWVHTAPALSIEVIDIPF